DRPISPGNLGSTIRSADAFGVSGLVVAGHAADIYDPVSVRSSLGALFAMPVVRVGSPDEVSAWLKAQSTPVKLIGTSVKAEKTPDEISFEKPLALLFGNETVGISKRFEELCDELVGIPMKGVASSINVSCAATVFMYLATAKT
ncbi:MAG: TrmH family RNA methyltransferase, partial [Proteobacteria bacterium]|nr:TrmH family RNA methyltransferase [Pseudomonadota bacterium]